MGHMRFSHILFSVVLFISADSLDDQNSGRTALELRLGGPHRYEGRVEVRRSSGEPWGVICFDGWSRGVTEVICRQLNLGHGRVIEGQDPGNSPMYMDFLKCVGTEASLDNCSFSSWRASSFCLARRAAAVHCQPLACSGVEDPGDLCSPSQNTDLQLRLVGGTNDREGRVEVRLDDGEWGTICDDHFGVEAATVVCRQLKLGVSGYATKVMAQYGTPPPTMHLDDIDCNGTESNLGHCGHAGWGNNNCERSEAVHVICFGETTTLIPTTQSSSSKPTTTSTTLIPTTQSSSSKPTTTSTTLIPTTQSSSSKPTTTSTTLIPTTQSSSSKPTTTSTTLIPTTQSSSSKPTTTSTTLIPTTQSSSSKPTTTSTTLIPTTQSSSSKPTTTSTTLIPTTQSSSKPTTTSTTLIPTTQSSSSKPTTTSTTLIPTTQSSSSKPTTTSTTLIPTTQSSSSKPTTTSPETTTTPLAESDKTSILRNLTKSAATEQTVVQTRQVLQQRGETSAADVVEVAEILRRASQLQNLSAQTATDLLEIVDTVAELNLTVLHKSNSVGNTTNRLIGVVEQLADKVSLEEGPVRLQTSSTVLQVWNLTAAPQSPVFGLRLNTAGETQDVTSVNNQSDADTFANVETAVMLPGEIGRSIVEDNSGRDVRLSASVIKQTSLFQVGKQRDTTHTDTPEAQSTDRDTEDRPTAGVSLNSKVISLRITVDGRPVTDLAAFGQGNVTAVFLPLEPLSEKLSGEWRERTQCVFWDFAERQGAGGWSRKGCHLEGIVSDKMICLCDHLTNFAILMDLYEPDVKRARFHENLLSMISLVGLTFSICSLSITLLVFILVKKLHKSLPQQTLFNTSLALLLSWVTFLAGIQRVEDHVTCVAVAMLLHYFILVTFLWMLAQGVLQYFMLVKAMKRPFTRYMLKAGLLAWGLPVLPVIIVSAVDVELYRGREDYCWMSLTAFYYAFLAPIAVIVTINIVIYLLVVVSICRRPNLSSGGTSYTAISVRASVSCFVVLGLSWIFAFMAVGDAHLVFQYLFAVTTTFQGFLIFLLYTARDRDVRVFFMSKFRKEDRSSMVSEHRRPSGPRRNVETPSTKETSFTRSK
ncbi:uncharacterized protein LOC143282567 [Babylonia areolata]|uniref:uncharacterized protein LOC143282567 n=1 Tax=Babylonia areolata TaxID=304850 RepID=UPI003FD5354E